MSGRQEEMLEQKIGASDFAPDEDTLSWLEYSTFEHGKRSHRVSEF